MMLSLKSSSTQLASIYEIQVLEIAQVTIILWNGNMKYHPKCEVSYRNISFAIRSNIASLSMVKLLQQQQQQQNVYKNYLLRHKLILHCFTIEAIL